MVLGGGVLDVAPLVVTAVVVTLVFRDGTINRLGPLSFEPELPLAVLVPVVLRNGLRLRVARAVSYLSVLAVSIGVLALGSAITGGSLLGPLRTLLLLTALAAAVGAVVGPAYAWLPVIVVLGSTLVAPAGDGAWTLYGLVLRPETTPGQLTGVGLAYLVGVGIAVLDPRHLGAIRT